MYLTPDHPDAFIDFPPLYSTYEDSKLVLRSLPPGKNQCAKCKGHGGWNLRVGAYPKSREEERKIRASLEARPYVNSPGHDMSDEEFRHHYVHFRASCNNCNGWGYVDEKQGDHVHTWDEGRVIGRCLRVYTCTGCGVSWEVDSSD